MIRFRLQELLAEKQFKEGRRVTLTELATVTGISRITLSKMVNVRGYGTLTDHLDRLCRFFDCDLSALAQYIPDEEVDEFARRGQTTSPQRKSVDGPAGT